MAFYDRTASRKRYQNADGPGGSTIDYGDPRGKGQDQRYQEARARYGNSPWYGREGDTTPMPWADPDTPFWTPNAGDPRNAGYFVQHESPFVADIPAAKAAARAAYNADPAYAAAKGAGDIKGQIAAMTALKQANQQQRFVDQGGTAATWQNRFDPNNNWPVPRSPSGNYQYGPGRPGPTPPGVASAAANNPAPPGGGGQVTQIPASTMTGGSATGGNNPGFGRGGMTSQPAAAPGPEEAAGNGSGGSGWRKDFKRLFVNNGGTGSSFQGEQARLNPTTFSYKEPVDRSLNPTDYRAMTGARDQARKQVMGMPAKFLDLSRRNPNTGTWS